LNDNRANVQKEGLTRGFSPSVADEQLTWASPLKDRRARIVLFVLAGIFFGLCAMPVLRDGRNTDPLTGTMNDHVRHRYCAAFLATQPIRSLTRPLIELYNQDTSRFKVASWSESPCTQAGPVFFLVHAPFQWALDGGMVSPPSATAIYVLLMLACAHLFLLLGLACDGVWPGTLLVFPWLVGTALMGLATPLTSCLGLLAYRGLATQRLVRGAIFFALAMASFSRWVVVFPAILYLVVYLGRDTAWPQVQTYWQSWWGRVRVLAGAACLLWCLVATGLVWVSWKDLTTTLSPMAFLLRGGIWLTFTILLLRWRSSGVAAVGASFGAFFVLYKSTMMAWYIEPLVPLFALAKRRSEFLAWGILLLLASQAFDGVPNLVEVRLLTGWLWRSWILMLN